MQFPISSLQLNLRTLDTQHHRFIPDLFRIKASIIKSMLAIMATETLIMPFSAQRINILSNNRLLAFFAFRRAVGSTFGLAGETPSISILLDMCLPLFERITTLSAEEMTVVPVFA
jgi:hypothetical protein